MIVGVADVIVGVADGFVAVADVIVSVADVIFFAKVQASCLPNRLFESKSPILTNETAICVGKYEAMVQFQLAFSLAPWLQPGGSSVPTKSETV